jgi:glycosyltransferase involved in cell wall biosynthesis
MAAEKSARRVEVVPEGAFVDRFELEAVCCPDAGAPLKLLYYGHLHRQHFDFALVDAVAKQRPEWRLTLIGPLRTPHTFPANVTVVPQQSHEKLRDFLAEAHVIFLPYVLNDYTRDVFPAKTYECLATGLPVVATPLPTLVELGEGMIEFGKSPSEVVEAVLRAVSGNTPGLQAQKRSSARKNTWDVRYARIRELLSQI